MRDQAVSHLLCPQFLIQISSKPRIPAPLSPVYHHDRRGHNRLWTRYLGELTRNQDPHLARLLLSPFECVVELCQIRQKGDIEVIDDLDPMLLGLLREW